MEIEILYFVQDWYEEKDFAGAMASSRQRWLNHTLNSGTLESKTPNSCAGHSEEYYKVGARDWLAQDFELSQDFGSMNYQIHRTALFSPHHPTKVTRTNSLMDPPVIESINMPNCPRQVPQTNQSWQGDWQCFGWGNSHDMWDPSVCHSWRWQL